MFAFKIWGNFACFRDPLTISQNITFPIPPKTAVGGMMAAIMGLEYDAWMDDDEYFNFKYSVVTLTPIRKKSFVQNYINDYTKHVETKISKRLEKGLREAKNPQKQVSRELLLNPKYLVVVDDFKYEQEAIELLKNHESHFPFYLGNSEFLGNFEFVGDSFDTAKVDIIHSFTKNLENIDFMQPNKKYTNIKVATKTVSGRRYQDYENFVVCSSKDATIKLKQTIEAARIMFEDKEYYCEMA